MSKTPEGVDSDMWNNKFIRNVYSTWPLDSPGLPDYWRRVFTDEMLTKIENEQWRIIFLR